MTGLLEREGSSTRDAFAAALAAQMRTPLSLIELAASQLERGAVTPGAQHLVARVSEAVDDLDQLIAKMLALLVPPTSDEVPMENLRSVLLELHERLAPVMAARGVEWRQETTRGDELWGDPRRAQRVMLVLVRAAGQLAGRGGDLAIELRQKPELLGFTLLCQPGHTDVESVAAQLALADIRVLAAREEGVVEEGQVDGAREVTLWLPANGRCPAEEAATSAAGLGCVGEQG